VASLEDLTRGASVKGVLPEGVVTVVDVRWHGSNVVELTYKDATGRLGNELLYRDREATLEVVEAGRPWSFDGDGELLRLVSEAHRIGLAYLFDPLLAVHTSLIESLPHQITGVYGEMLSRQPLRFLLADDPGAGKTIMAGLLIKELMIRGDVQRCLICAPGSLVEQWQDELAVKFHLPFQIVTRATIESSLTGNPFAEMDLVIARLDQMARNDDVQAKLQLTDWDLVICDEAHKMSASFFGNEVKRTKRYDLGLLLGKLARHFPCAFMHLHSTSMFLLDAFLEIEELRCFEINYDAAGPPLEAMLPHFARVQAAGRSLLVRGSFRPEELRRLVDALDPKGLMLLVMARDRAEVDSLRAIVGM